jgi:hypothetical protein
MIGRMALGPSVVALALLTLSGAAGAQQPTQAQANAIKQSCRSDYMTHCSNVPTGGKAALNCLEEHLTDLSPACQSAVGAVSNPATHGGSSAQSRPPMGGGMGGGMAGGMGAGAPPMGGREEMRMMRAACGRDYREYCQGTELGGGRAMGCLKEHASQLSPQCRDMMGRMSGG